MSLRLALAAGLAALGLAAVLYPSPWSAPAADDLRLRGTERLAESGFSLARLDGGSDRFAGAPGKTLVVNFWATWCAPCRRELPSLQRLADAVAADRVEIIGVSIDKDGDFVREYLRDAHVRFAGHVDPGQATSRGMFGIETLPQTLVIGPDGRFARIEGVREWDAPAVREAIARLASDPADRL